MAAQHLTYTGINRALSDYAGTSACEELINLRPATEGVVPVKDFSVKMSNINFERIYVHHTTSGPHYIVIRKGTGTVYVQWLDELTDTSPTYHNFEGLTISGLTETQQENIVNSISYAAAANVLLFSICDKEDEKFYNFAYTWKNSGNTMTYVKMDGAVPQITTSISDGSGDVVSVSQKISRLNMSSEKDDVNSAVETALNEIQENNPNLCLGSFIWAIAFKTTDGKTFWTNKFGVYDPVWRLETAANTNYVNSSSDLGNFTNEYTQFFADHGNAGFAVGFAYAALDSIIVEGTNVSLSLTMPSGVWNEETSIIQSVEVYASKPKIYLNANYAYDGYKWLLGNAGEYMLILPMLGYEELDLENQLLYLQASIPVSSLSGTTQTVNFSFGGNVQVTNETLEVDAGAVKRYGKVLAYNARFHYYDSVSHIEVGMPSFNFIPLSQTSQHLGTADIFVQYEDDDQTELVHVGSITNFEYVMPAYFVIAPSICVKEVITYTKGSDNKYYLKKYRMSASPTYNYSVCYTGPYYNPTSPSSSPITPYSGMTSDDNIVRNSEPTAINVSEQYNPFVFLVEHSYKAPGNILDVKPQMAGIVDSSYGRDPLNVFTERGVYALTQGSANVLYGAFLPVTNDVVSAASVPTEMGIFYLAGGSLWLLSGRRATLVSDALHLGPHKYIRASRGYQKIAGGGTSTPEYDVSALVSQVTFEDFVRTGGKLSFNRFRMEILVSNANYGYTYVLSLKYRQWFKFGRRLWQDEAGGDIASTPGATTGNINVVDLASEETGSVLVHLQTRPFSFNAAYAHVHRIVALIRARLSGVASDKLVVGLYGSDDLQNWKLLSYAKRTGSTTVESEGGTEETTDNPLYLSQIRTSSSARSWRYYTVCIGGQVPAGTDFPTDIGPVIVDYEPVIRRIG